MWAWLLVARSGGRISGEIDGATIDIDDAVLVQLPEAGEVERTFSAYRCESVEPFLD
jgi:hypothetical protein